MPVGGLSTIPMLGEYIYPDNILPTPVLDYEYGGIGLSNPSAGMLYQVWHAKLLIDPVTTIGSIYIGSDNTPDTFQFAGVGITDISLAFDQNMHPFIAYVQSGQAKFYWYDPTVSMFVITNLPAGSGVPRCCLDDKRALENSQSDILLFYIRAGTLYYRVQRERYLNEYSLATGLIGEVLHVGMNDKNRIQIMYGVSL